MRDILIACATRAEAERGMRLAADLSAACGADVALLAATCMPVAIEASAAGGLDAVGHLSSVLFSTDRRGCSPLFIAPEAEWLADFTSRVQSAAVTETLAADVIARQPGLVIACNRDIARELVATTRVPVWHLKGPERSWFSARRVRCALRGGRAAGWAQSFAASLGLELQAAPARLFGGDVDLVVTDREHQRAWPVAPPLVVV